MNRGWVRVVAAILIVAVPLIVHAVYSRVTALPESIRIAAGPEDGRYLEICRRLAEAIEESHGIDVEVLVTEGSLENIDLLVRDEADFGLYQPGTRTILRGGEVPQMITSVGNVYSEVTHFLVRAGVQIDEASDLAEKRINLGQKNSGDYAMSLVLMQHLGLDEADFVPMHEPYTEVEKLFRAGKLDAALITAGMGAAVFKDLLTDGTCVLEPLPHAEALASKGYSVANYTIPAGYYQVAPRTVPPEDMATVATRAQLLTRQKTPTALVEEVTRTVMGAQFQKQAALTELFSQDHAFALYKPEFPIHPGANHFYDPELRPILNTEFVEATEGMRSFIVSLLVASYFTYRWIKRRRVRAKDHKLDRYIRKLLEIERRQLPLDKYESESESDRLEELLDEVTRLRQEALSDFTAHNLSEDRAVDCFLEMCHALSDKLNAKILRHRLDARFADLVKALAANRD